MTLKKLILEFLCFNLSFTQFFMIIIKLLAFSNKYIRKVVRIRFHV